jgi:transcriptional regulator with XRE-family HTH domain
MVRTTRKGNGSLRLYRSYNFVDKDPIIDELRTIDQKEGLTYRQVHYLSGISESTMRNWFEGKTKRPQNASIEAFVRALGYKRVLQKAREVNYEKEIEKAKLELSSAS